MKTPISALALLFSALFFATLLIGCNREHVDGELIVSYSIKTDSEADREAIVNDFEAFLAHQFGLKKAAGPYSETAGVKIQGEKTELWESASAPYAITISKNPNPKYLSGNISWNFRGSNEAWKKQEIEIQQFQRKVVDWFKKRPDVLHTDSSYWEPAP